MEQSSLDREEYILQNGSNDQESIFLEDPDTQQVELNQKGQFRQENEEKHSQEMVLQKQVKTNKRGRKRKINLQINNNNENNQNNNLEIEEKEEEKEQSIQKENGNEEEDDLIKKELASTLDDNYDDLIDSEEFAKTQNKGISRYGNKKGRRRANEKDHNLPLDNITLMNTLQKILKEYGFLEGNVELDLTVQDNELKIQEKQEQIDQLDKTMIFTSKEEEEIEEQKQQQQQNSQVQNNQPTINSQQQNSKLQNTVGRNHSSNDRMQERRFSRSYTLSEDLRIICEMSQKTNLINGYSSNYWKTVVNQGKILRPHESLRDRYKRFLKYITADDLEKIIHWIERNGTILGFLNFTKFKNNFKTFSHVQIEDPFSSKKQSFSGRPLKKLKNQQRNGSDSDSSQDSEEESDGDMKQEKLEQNSEQIYKIENKLNKSYENTKQDDSNKMLKKDILEDRNENGKEVQVKLEEHPRKQMIIVNGMTEAIEIDSSDMSDEEIKYDPIFQKYKKQCQLRYKNDLKQQKKISQIMESLKLPKLIQPIENINDQEYSQNVKDEWKDIMTISKKEEEEEEDQMNENINQIIDEQYFLQEQQVKVEDNYYLDITLKEEIIKDDQIAREDQLIDDQNQHESKGVDEQSNLIVQSMDESYQYQNNLELPIKIEEYSLEFEVKAEAIDSLMYQEIVQKEEEEQQQDQQLESHQNQKLHENNNNQEDDSELYVQETRWIKCTNRLGSNNVQEQGYTIDNHLYFV